MANPGLADGAAAQEVLDAVVEIRDRYGLSALDDLIQSCREFAAERTLNIAVLGRFKAGKSTFLNHLLGRALLPVGVVPVTSIVTEIGWGPQEKAEILFTDGQMLPIPLEQLNDFISEARNPKNFKNVKRARLEVPSMDRYPGIRFVDTPGLESVFAHNTDAALEWLPGVGIALVAVGVDPPLSQRDVELIQNLTRYTPNISLLLTKVDILDEKEREQVREFVQGQLAVHLKDAVRVFPYSARPGFEHLRNKLDSELLQQAGATARQQRAAILEHKLRSLLSECESYLNVALQAAAAADSEREQMRLRILGDVEMLDDTRLALKRIIRHENAQVRGEFELLLQRDVDPIRGRIGSRLTQEFPAWTRSLRIAMERYDDWVSTALAGEIAELSGRHAEEFSRPLRRGARQLSRTLQDFRNRLSIRVLEALGVPLETTELELNPGNPKSPDILVGKIFDRNWELLSWLIPMPVIRGLVLNRFREKAGELVFTNVSRLAAQWEEIVKMSLDALEKDAVRRFDGLINTIGALVSSSERQVPRIRVDIRRVSELRVRAQG